MVRHVLSFVPSLKHTEKHPQKLFCIPYSMLFVRRSLDQTIWNASFADAGSMQFSWGWSAHTHGTCPECSYRPRTGQTWTWRQGNIKKYNEKWEAMKYNELQWTNEPKLAELNTFKAFPKSIHGPLCVMMMLLSQCFCGIRMSLKWLSTPAWRHLAFMPQVGEVVEPESQW